MSVFASAAQRTEEQAKPDPDWWRGAVIYQIYPRSYQDSNGDGIGDLAGIRQRLPYIAGLGADAIWISPFFPSPMKDFGYDVTDYRGVDPMFGSVEDFRVLVDDAHHLGLKVMIDLVMSHTSDQHPWFTESRSNRENHKADWYVWADAKPDGSPPNNWLSIFGGSAWEWDSNRLQYYMHNFLTSQPDLNFHNPDVQNELLDMVRFWLELGVDGFRLDTINFYFHSQTLKDNPPLPPELRNAKTAPAVNPYNYQDHLYDKSQPENIEFLKRFRAVLDEFPAAAAVGEVGDSQRDMEILADYTRGDDRIHMCYAFDFLAPDPLTAEKVREVAEKFEVGAPDGWSCWAFSNHDVVRHASRWGAFERDPERYLSVIAGILFTLRGSVSIYQGEELGLPEGRYFLRGSAGSLRHPLLAEIQGPRWRAHADGLVVEPAQWRLHHRQALAACAGHPPRHGRRYAAGARRQHLRILPRLPRVPARQSGVGQGRHLLHRHAGRCRRLYSRRWGNENPVRLQSRPRAGGVRHGADADQARCAA